MDDVFKVFGKKIKCLVCNCLLPSSSDSSKHSHANGKRHIFNVERQKEKNNVFNRSVYVKGFGKKVTDIEEKLTNFFKDKLLDIKEIYIDKNMSVYAMIEFSDDAAVEKAIELDGSAFEGGKLIIKKRVKKETSTVVSNEGPFRGRLLDVLQQCSSKSIPSFIGMLHSELQLNKDDIDLRNLTCDLIQSVLEEVYPDCQVQLFGSSVNGLGVIGCDMDLTLLTKDLVLDESEAISEIRDVIQKFAPGCKHVLIVRSTKTCSIVRFLHTESKLSVDLSLNNRLGIANTALLSTYMRCHQHCLPLAFTVRVWAKYHKLTGHSGLKLSNYALTLMVIHYLQNTIPPVLVRLQSCHVPNEKRELINGWDCYFCEKCSEKESKINSTLDELLLGFFLYYSTFDYTTYGVSIHGTSKLTRGDLLESLDSENTSAALLVQDPFKRTHNVAKNLTKTGLDLVTEKFKSVTSSLESLFPRKSLISKKKMSTEHLIELTYCAHHVADRTAFCVDVITSYLRSDLNMRVEADSKKSNSDQEVEPNRKRRKISSEKVFTVTSTEDKWTNQRKVRRSREQSSHGNGNQLFSFVLTFEESCDSGFCRVRLRPSLTNQHFQTFFAVFKKHVNSIFR